MGALTIFEDPRTLIGQHWRTLELARVHNQNLSYAALVPLEQLPGLIAELDHALRLCTRQEAEKAAGYLLGSYARHEIEDPDIWVRAVRKAFADYPASLAGMAVDNLTARLKSVPNRAHVIEELEALTQPIRAARIMAIAMQREHARRDEDARLNAQIEAGRKKFREQHGGLSPLEVARQKQERPND
jgi:hypothetical protein